MNDPRAKDIFLDAIDLPAQRQDEFVRAACDSDDALLAQVQALLEAHRSRPGMLEGPAPGFDDSTLAELTLPPGAHPPTEQPGDMIDRYRLVRVLGEGGFGSVFLAQQLRPVVRDVALKVIRRGMDTDQIIARFEMERQALALMDHPGIARVIDAGATASGRPYFVMEYVEGIPITQYCEQNELGTSQRLELIEQACLAVQHAHQKGIIHRDLKPGNILVTRVDDRPIPKIIDFGIAKATDPELPGSSGAMPVTLEAQIIGTPQYMSPEQASGGASRIDTRTDVYSLGTVLYELITGTPPFDPQVLRSAGLGEFGRIILDQVPAKPSTRLSAASRASQMRTTTLGRIRRRRQLADEIDWIIMKALEKEPSRRYQSPAELAADIRRHLSDQAVLAGPPSRLYQLRKFARRHRAPLAAAAIVAIALLATAVISATMAARARRAEANALEQLARANAIVGFTDDLLGGIAPAVARGRDTTLLRELLDDSIRKADASFTSQPTIDLAVRHTIGEALNNLGDPVAALAQLRKVYDATAGPQTHDHPQRLRVAVTMAQIHLELFDTIDAEPLVREALAGYQRIGQLDSDDGYLARLAEAGLLLRSGHSEQAEQRYATILEHYRGLGRGESAPALLAWDNLALSISDQGRWEQACELWRGLNEVDRRLFGENHPYTMTTLNDIGTALTHLGRMDEAEATMRQSLAIARRIFEPGHPTLLVNMNNLGAMLIDLNKLDDADAILTEALQTGSTKLGTLDQPMDVITLQLGRLRAKQGRFDEAIKYAYQLYDAVAAKYGQRHVRTLSALVLVYDNLIQAHRGAEGVAIVEKIGDLPPEVSPDLRQRLEACAGLLYLSAGNEPAARRHAILARGAVQKNPDGTERVTGSLRVLESRLHLVPTSRPATMQS